MTRSNIRGTIFSTAPAFAGIGRKVVAPAVITAGACGANYRLGILRSGSARWYIFIMAGPTKLNRATAREEYIPAAGRLAEVSREVKGFLCACAAAPPAAAR